MRFNSSNKEQREQPFRYYPDGTPSTEAEYKTASWIDVYYEGSNRVKDAEKKAQRAIPRLSLMNNDQKKSYLENNEDDDRNVMINKYFYGYIGGWANLLRDEDITLKFDKESMEYLIDEPNAQSFLINIMLVANDGTNYGLQAPNTKDKSHDQLVAEENEEIAGKSQTGSTGTKKM